MLPDLECLEKENLAIDIDVKCRQAPLVVGDRRLFKEQLSALLDVADNAPTDVHITARRAFQFDDALGGRVDPKIALGSAKKVRFFGGRTELRVRFETQSNGFSPANTFRACVFIKKSIWQNTQHL